MPDPGIAPQGEPQSFAEYLLRVNPTPEALANLAKQADETPIIMLNLLRFRPRRDPHIYSLYGKDAAPQVVKTGSYVGFFGFSPENGITEEFSPDWDASVLVVYKGRRSFPELQANPIYQLAIPLRSAGTYARLLYVLQDDPTRNLGTLKIADLNESRAQILPEALSVTALDLWHCDDAALAHDYGAALKAAAACQVPVLSQEYYHGARVLGLPDQNSGRALWASAPGQEAANMRLRPEIRTLSVMAEPKPLPT